MAERPSEAERAYSRVNLVADPLYGNIAITKSGKLGAGGASSEQDILDSPWLQRLRRIRQLQSAWWVFPSATHDRFQHSLGVMHLAGEWAKKLYPSLKEVYIDAPSAQLVEETLRMAGLLHDVGHGPFSHWLDDWYAVRWHLDHEIVGRHLILNQLSGMLGSLGASPSADFEADEKLDARWVAYLMADDDLKGYEAPLWLRAMKPVMVAPFSADNLDYIPRDILMCGVRSAAVDVQTIIQHTFISKYGMAIHAQAKELVYMFLIARLHMYHHVYYHQTGRRIDLQLKEVFSESVGRMMGGKSPLEDLDAYRNLTDWSLFSTAAKWLESADPDEARLGKAWDDILARRLKWKLVYSSYLEAFSGSNLIKLKSRQFAKRIRANLPPALADIPFEVDVASKGSAAVNPLQDTGRVVFWDDLRQRYETQAVTDLMARLPSEMAVFRVFALEDTYRTELTAAADKALGVKPTAHPTNLVD
jgi:HD superfamily phosphohydrolase